MNVIDKECNITLAERSDHTLTQISIHGLEEFSSPLSQITNTAKKELGSFLCAVRQVFGHDEVDTAADLWIANFETTDWIDANTERTCRRVTIQAFAQLVEARAFARAMRTGAVSGPQSRFEGNRQ
jgi:hypothetical protein